MTDKIVTDNSAVVARLERRVTEMQREMEYRDKLAAANALATLASKYGAYPHHVFNAKDIAQHLEATAKLYRIEANCIRRKENETGEIKE